MDELETLLNTPIEAASKRKQKSLHSPQAIEVLSGEQIRASGAWRLMDLLQLMTGVQVYDMDGQIGRVAMRGVAPNGTPKTIQVLLDGVALYNTEVFPTDIDGIPVPLDAIERVELVRGPSSTLYGANAQLGVIAITTKKAGRGQQGSFRAGGETQGGFRSQGTFLFGGSDLSLSAAFGALTARTLDEPQRGVASPVTHRPENPYHQQQIHLRPAFGYDGGSLWAWYGQSYKRTGPEINLNAAGTRLYGLTTQRFQVEAAQVGWTHRWTSTLTSTLKGNHTKILDGMGGGVFAVPGNPDSPLFAATVRSAVPGFATMEDLADFKSHEAALQVNWSASPDLHVVLGGDTRKLRTPGSPIQGIPALSLSASGGFLSAEWNAGWATFSAGARVENETLGGSRTSPRLAVVVPLDGVSVLRAGFYTSTRSPQMTETYGNLNSPFVSFISIANLGLEPEKAGNVEVGYRRTFARWSLDLTLYRMRLQQAIASVSVGSQAGKPIKQFRNADADETNQGLELALQGEVLPGWMAGCNAAFVDYRSAALGAQAPFAPRASANLWSRVRSGSFFGFLALQQVGGYSRNSIGTTALGEEKARFQVHFNLGWEPLYGCSVSLYGINAAHAVTHSAAAGFQNAFLTRYARRELGLQAAYRF